MISSHSSPNHSISGMLALQLLDMSFIIHRGEVGGSLNQELRENPHKRPMIDRRQHVALPLTFVTGGIVLESWALVGG